MQFGSIFGNKNFRIVSPFSPAIIDDIKKDENKKSYVEECLSDSKFKKLIDVNKPKKKNL